MACLLNELQQRHRVDPKQKMKMMAIHIAVDREREAKTDTSFSGEGYTFGGRFPGNNI
jgi:hypothetical protein